MSGQSASSPTNRCAILTVEFAPNGVCHKTHVDKQDQVSDMSA